MRVITLGNDIVQDGVIVKAGKPHIWPGTGNKLKRSGAEIKSIKPIDSVWNQYNGEDVSGKSVLISRAGGHGDMVMLSPLIRQLKANGASRVALVSRPQYHDTIRCIPGLDSLGTVPFPTDLLAGFDYHLSFEGAIRGDTTGKYCSTLFADLCGLTLDSEKSAFALPPNLVRQAKRFLEVELGIERKIIAIHTEASATARGFLPGFLPGLCRALTANKYHVVLIGRDSQGVTGANITDLCGKFKSVAMYYAIVSETDLLIAPDSIMLHVASALDKKAIGLFGPFNGASRVIGDTVRYLDGVGDCKRWPCRTHDYGVCKLAKQTQASFSPCMNHAVVDVASLAANMVSPLCLAR